jgi:hypothetical protein
MPPPKQMQATTINTAAQNARATVLAQALFLQHGKTRLTGLEAGVSL